MPQAMPSFVFSLLQMQLKPASEFFFGMSYHNRRFPPNHSA
jgi:hypothetical protein